MSKHLITEGWEAITPFEGVAGREGLISEADCAIVFEGEMKKKEDGSRTFEGILQRANKRNKNGRIYPSHILERETRKLVNLINENGGVLGELDHPETVTINMQKVCQRLDKLHMGSNGIVEGRITMLPSLPLGEAAIACADALGGKVGQSSRGGGTLFKKGDDIMVGEDYSMKTYDVVHDPSTHGAYTASVDESLIREFVDFFHAPKKPHSAGRLTKLVEEWLGLPG